MVAKVKLEGCLSRNLPIGRPEASDAGLKRRDRPSQDIRLDGKLSNPIRIRELFQVSIRCHGAGGTGLARFSPWWLK
jgi:hypothetical protein